MQKRPKVPSPPPSDDSSESDAAPMPKRHKRKTDAANFVDVYGLQVTLRIHRLLFHYFCFFLHYWLRKRLSRIVTPAAKDSIVPLWLCYQWHAAVLECISSTRHQTYWLMTHHGCLQAKPQVDITKTSPIRISDIQALLLWVLADGIMPTWAFVKVHYSHTAVPRHDKCE